jgi:C1A family cysteine protease
MAQAPKIQKIKHFGWAPDLPDARDHLFAAAPQVLTALPPSVDLRKGSPGLPPPYDQGQLGSCTGNAIAGAVQFGRRKAKQTPDFVPSRLFIYYNERVIEGSVKNDSGAQIRDGIKSVAKQGVCNETAWPYDIAKFAKKPPAAAYKEAAKHEITQYSRLPQIVTQLKGCLAAGFPFVFGFTVYEAFESPEVAKTGVLNMPNLTKEKVVGGHAVLAVGYNDSQQRFIIRNSWGHDWGQKGYFTMPYGYLTDNNLSDDFWTIRVVA